MSTTDWTRRTFVKNAAAAGVAAAAAPALLRTRPAAADAAGTLALEKIALANARVFDGRTLTEPRTVVIDNGRIGVSALGARTIDAKGATLLPGLIDAHVHLEDVSTLEQLTGYGVTTALDMACWPPSLMNSLRHRTGLTDVRSAGIPAVAPGSLESQLPGFPQSELVTGSDQAGRFVAARVAEGSDYIKLIVDTPGLSQDTLDALANAAHAYGKLVMAHATSSAAVDEALLAGADMIHHVPLDIALTGTTAARYAAGRRVSVPTLTMMEGFAALGIPGLSYAAARDSVIALHQAGVRILAGTDSNHKQGIPVQPAFGTSLHHELELLVQAGLGTVEALQAATVLPARSFGLYDRGVVTPGCRADLILIDGDPIADIRATRNIQRIWAGGIEYAPAA
ncbi:amidohydrolase family protein [Actinomadura opuntiae]|uniref:amidohydrolase family protein n=1 Tax=Actinomadura sp. OS1-43 TaxID=604315 RepID=UPI00255B1A06|nr:amidohydrolase family protein [Actinomadura sp. OS1-43]MDL4813279.1 amidohydrolase family protein [Actinomadura sp. OS1-43]